jgi:hypothetical protein
MSCLPEFSTYEIVAEDTNDGLPHPSLPHPRGKIGVATVDGWSISVTSLITACSPPRSLAMMRLRFETGDAGKLLGWGAQGLDRPVGGTVAADTDCHGLDVAAA